MENILSCVELDLFDHLGELTNAKIHDVSYYCYENNIEESIFNDFCFDEWDFFENNIKEINVDILHLNPFTSSFYFINNDYNFNCYYLSSFGNATNEEKSKIDEILLLNQKKKNQKYDKKSLFENIEKTEELVEKKQNSFIQRILFKLKNIFK